MTYYSMTSEQFATKFTGGFIPNGRKTVSQRGTQEFEVWLAGSYMTCFSTSLEAKNYVGSELRDHVNLYGCPASEGERRAELADFEIRRTR